MFEFGPRSYDSHQPVKAQECYDAIADQAIAIFDATGEPWLAPGRSRLIPVRPVRRLMVHLSGRWVTVRSPASRPFFPGIGQHADRLPARWTRAAALPLGGLAENRRAYDRTG